MDIEQTFDRNHARLMSVPGVTGLGIGAKDGRPAIVVLVKESLPDHRAQIPSAIDGFPVVVQYSGEISAL